MKSQKILIVDDEIEILHSLTYFFEREGGFEILTTDNGADAINMAAVSEPDLVLLDVDLPVLNGFEVLEEIKKREIKTRIVMISGKYVDTDSAIKGIKNGACDYILKPLSFFDLLNRVKKHLVVESTINYQVSEVSPFVNKLMHDIQALKERNQELLKANQELRRKKYLPEVITKFLYVIISIGSIYLLSKIGAVAQHSTLLLAFLLLFLLLMIPLDKIQRITAGIKNLKAKIDVRS